MISEDTYEYITICSTNVGKTTTAKFLAKRINYEFYDVDNYVIELYGSIDKFHAMFPYYYNRGIRLIELLKELIIQNYNKNSVISVTTIWDEECFKELFEDKDNFIIELTDTPENIFERLIFTDENDVICKDSVEYREAHRDYYLNSIREDIEYLKETNKNIKTKIFMNNQPPEEVVEMIYMELQRQKII